ncbi:flavin reductase family protein [Roseibium sp. CAU 1637]|uniref:Flavin reductase family protein n=1 Tax=Roseibium limicola TaxID=2816037 RepID=A0A939EL47_9HYPH|nr:flavin reductase family protein [Roseibium limicola]MBO0344130.1 flavin reductase family protein [Roseibium limicola]
MNMQTRPPAISFQPDDQNTRLLRDAFGRFATGVTVVTAASEDGPVGMTVNSFSSVSLSPPLVLWAADKSSRRSSYFETAEYFAIHVLSNEQADLCKGFAKEAQAFEGLDVTTNAQGVPLIENCLARFECSRFAAYDGGDHVILLGQVINAEMREGEALTFFAGKLGQIGQS